MTSETTADDFDESNYLGWDVERDRAGNRENDIQMAMKRAGLKPTKYADKVKLEDLDEPTKAKIKLSELETRQRSGHVKPDDPSLLIGLLKFVQGDIREKKRLWVGFLSQWQADELNLLKAVGSAPLIDGGAVDWRQVPLLVEHEEHPFVKHAQAWRSLVDSHPYSIQLLEQVQSPTFTLEMESEARWAFLVDEYAKWVAEHPLHPPNDDDGDDDNDDDDE
jgi:hypothetical protein